VGVSRDCQFLGTPIISRTGKATDFKFCRNIHSIGSIGTKASENVGNVSRGRNQGIPKIFRVPIGL